MLGLINLCDKKIRVMNVLLYASSIGQREGKKATMDHSSCVEHHSQRVSSLVCSFFVLDARHQVRAKYMALKGMF